MSQDHPDFTRIDPQGMRFAIVAACYNQRQVDTLLGRVLETLHEAGVAADAIETIRVPGSNEVPYAAHMLAETGEFDCLIALGVVVAGETSHHEVIAYTTAQALMRAGTESEVPIINGIITANSPREVEARCGGQIDRGREFALAALKMAAVKSSLEGRIDSGFEEMKCSDFECLKDLENEDPDDDQPPWRS